MRISTHTGPLPQPIRLLEQILEQAGTTVIQAAFRYSYFIDPVRVREKCPYYPDRVRMSREHYPGGDRGASAKWKDQPVTLGDNKRAQDAWAGYTGRAIARMSGYGVRHIWGNPWDPNAFTAGWNLCYMPFWLGMLTEDQHPNVELVKTVQQASFDLYFKTEPVCEKPAYVVDHGLNLGDILGDEPVQVLSKPDEAARERRQRAIVSNDSAQETIRSIRSITNASWSNILKATASLQGEKHEAFGTSEKHEAFGTSNVGSTSESIVRRMCRETGLSIRQLQQLVVELSGSKSSLAPSPGESS